MSKRLRSATATVTLKECDEWIEAWIKLGDLDQQYMRVLTTNGRDDAGIQIGAFVIGYILGNGPQRRKATR